MDDAQESGKRDVRFRIEAQAAASAHRGPPLPAQAKLGLAAHRKDPLGKGGTDGRRVLGN